MEKENMIKLGLVAGILLAGLSVTFFLRTRKRRPIQSAAQQMVKNKQEQMRV